MAIQLLLLFSIVQCSLLSHGKYKVYDMCVTDSRLTKRHCHTTGKKTHTPATAHT